MPLLDFMCRVKMPEEVDFQTCKQEMPLLDMGREDSTQRRTRSFQTCKQEMPLLDGYLASIAREAS